MNCYVATYLDHEGYEARRLVHAADDVEAKRLAAQILRNRSIVRIEALDKRTRQPSGAELEAALHRSRQRRRDLD